MTLDGVCGSLAAMAKDTVKNSRKGIASQPNTIVEGRKASAGVHPGNLKAFAESLDSFGKIAESYAPRTVSIEKLYGSAAIPRKFEGKDTIVSGRLVCGDRYVDRGGETVRESVTKDFIGWNQLNKFRESDMGKAKRLRESHGIDLNDKSAFNRWLSLKKYKGLREGDSFAYGNAPLTSPQYSMASGPNNEYVPLMLGPFNRNLYLSDFQEQASKGFWEYNHDPVAKALALLMLHFPIADGITVKFANPLCQQVWDDFCMANDWHNQIRKMAIELTIVGEAWIYDPIMEPAGMTLWDATTVWEVVTNPRDISQVFYAHRQWPTQWQLLLGSEFMRPDKMPPAQEYVIEQVGPQDWLHVRANATVGEKRGRSDYYPAFTWFKRFRDWFNAAVIKGMISNSFILWYSVDGSDSDVQAVKNAPDLNTVPPPGSTIVTNKAVVPTLMQSAAGVAKGDDTGTQILAIIAASMNIPPEYLGVESVANRATSITRSEPGWKTFECRQQLFREVVEWQVGRVMYKAQRDGLLPKNQPRSAAIKKVTHNMRTGDFRRAQIELQALSSSEMLSDELDMTFDIIMPKLQPEERSAYIKDIMASEQAGYISHQTAAEHTYESLDLQRVDYDEEQAKRREEAEEGITLQQNLDPMGQDGASPDGETEGDSGDTASYKKDNMELPE